MSVGTHFLFMLLFELQALLNKSWRAALLAIFRLNFNTLLLDDLLADFLDFFLMKFEFFPQRCDLTRESSLFSGLLKQRNLEFFNFFGVLGLHFYIFSFQGSQLLFQI